MTPTNDHIADYSLEEVVEPPADLSARIRRECTGDLTPRRSLSGTARVGLALGASCLVVLIMGAMGAAAERPAGGLRAALFGVIGWAVVQAALLFVGLAKPAGSGASRMVRGAIALLVPVAFFAYLALAATYSVPFSEFLNSYSSHALRCGTHALLAGALVAGGVLALWRRTDPFSPGLSGALAGLFGGLSGAVAVGVACPNGEVWHLWIGHGLVVLALVGAGWALGRRWLAP